MKLGEVITNMELYPEKEYRSDEITLSMHFGVLHIEGVQLNEGTLLLATKRNWTELPKYMDLSEVMELWLSGFTIGCEFGYQVYIYVPNGGNFVDTQGRAVTDGEMRDGKWFKF